MLLKDIIGVCMYNWYGAGGHQGGVSLPLTVQGDDLVNKDNKWVSTIRALSKFKLHRAFVDNFVMVKETQPPFTLSTNPTKQNFYFDEFFKLQKANGITNIWSASGCFDWYKAALGDNSQRKTACYDPTKSPSDPAAWADLAELCKQIAQRYNSPPSEGGAGGGNLTGLLDYIQVLNEWDFRWNVPHILTPEEYAVGFKVCYEAIRSVSPSQKIMVGATLTPDVATAKRFFGQLDQLRKAENKPVIRDVVYSANNYIRTDSNNQGNGIGATAEEVDRYGVFFKPLHDFLTEIGCDGAMLTEAGWSNTTSTSATGMKNKAPTLQGFTIDQAQGILAIRLSLILASLSKWKGITFYTCRDEYEAEPFTYNGFNRKDWSAKEVRLLLESFLSKYGEYSVTNYQVVNSIHYATLTRTTPNTPPSTLILHWCDRVNVGTATPMPTETASIPTPNPQPPTPEPPPPTITNMEIRISASVTKAPFDVLKDGAIITPGKYQVYAEPKALKTPVTFNLFKDTIPVKLGTSTNHRAENGYPYDMYGGPMFDFTAGEYKLTVTSSTETAEINFTVGNAMPPPPPPAIEPVLETYIKNGRVYFITASKTYSTAVE